ncbi:MAG: hypothetical protein M0Q02_12030, partial [Candidatus Muirbacterium halophilum]|nr:hypothetical protein [Candidatus Muirbacterium halophilum]
MNENCITYIDNRKLIHVTYMPYLSIGIYKKIKILARISEKNQYPIDFMILNLFKEKKYGNLHLKKIEFYKFIPRRIQSMFFKYKLIKKNIPWEKYKYIILRHVMYPDIDSIKMFKKYGNKIFSEHHTNEIMEIKSINKKLNLKKIIDFYLEKFLTPIKLKYSRGIIAVTKEIIDLEERKGGLKNSYLISNGCILSLNNIIKNNKFDNKILKIIFVSSVFYPWQGLDRILRSLKKYNGDLKIEFTIVGIINELELITKLLYEYWFLQFDFPNDEGKPYKSSGGKM